MLYGGCIHHMENMLNLPFAGSKTPLRACIVTPSFINRLTAFQKKYMYWSIELVCNNNRASYCLSNFYTRCWVADRCPILRLTAAGVGSQAGPLCCT